ESLSYRTRSPPSSTLFPYTTLFRSGRRRELATFKERYLVERELTKRSKERGIFLLLRSDESMALIREMAESGASISTIEARLRRSEEHTSELQSREKLVCCLLLEKK